MEIDIKSTEIKEIILSKLRKKESLFLLRLGDGEMRIEKNHESLSLFCVKQFNRELTNNEINKARNWLRESVIQSTILGLPTKQHCDRNELWNCMFDYYKEIKESNPQSWSNKRYCSINSHYDLLKKGELFEILKTVDKIIIVSPRNVSNKIKEKFTNIKDVEYYSLPGEQAYEVDKNIEIDIFDRIEEINLSMLSKNRAGEILIFGAGPLGKIIGANFYKAGGVAIDIGSVFDLFVGKVTRGPGKGPNTKIDPIL